MITSVYRWFEVLKIVLKRLQVFPSSDLLVWHSKIKNVHRNSHVCMYFKLSDCVLRISSKISTCTFMNFYLLNIL